jgi:iron complex transport system ATP-binding protein
MGKLEHGISIKSLSFGYSRNMILENIFAQIPYGSFTVIMGRNGSGKSTLLKLISGLLHPSEGDIYIDDKMLRTLSNRKKARLIGFLGQQHRAIFPFTVEEVVMTGRAAFVGIVPKLSDKLVVEESIERVGISHLMKRFYTDLSGGEQQLVMIARLLAQQPKILILDEPISHLDFNNQLRIIQLIKQLVNDGITVVATLHDPNNAFLFGDSFIFVHDKKVIADKTNEPWNNPLIHKIFHDEIELIAYKKKHLIFPKIN